jgi:hypothetical protein
LGFERGALGYSTSRSLPKLAKPLSLSDYFGVLMTPNQWLSNDNVDTIFYHFIELTYMTNIYFPYLTFYSVAS